MNKDIFRVLFFLSAMFFLVFCCSAAEVYEDPDMCFSLTQDGWIKDLINAYEIKASDTDLYGFDAFSALTFAAELGKVDFDISMDPDKPYDRALIFFDGNTFKPASADTTKPVTIVMNAIMDPEKLDEDLSGQMNRGSRFRSTASSGSCIFQKNMNRRILPDTDPFSIT